MLLSMARYTTTSLSINKFATQMAKAPLARYTCLFTVPTVTSAQSGQGASYYNHTAYSAHGWE